MPRRPETMLRWARRAAGLTQADLERLTGIRKSAISMYETGAREPGTRVFLKLLEAAGCILQVDRFSDEQLRRGRILSDLLAFASELPHRWPGDDLSFPSKIWKP